MSRLREPGTLRNPFYSKEDHGILTCTVEVDHDGAHPAALVRVEPEPLLQVPLHAELQSVLLRHATSYKTYSP